LRYRAASGCHTTQWHTPDFFVLRQGSAGWEEWKPLPALDGLAVRMPARYHQTTAGHWRCPPGEAYAEPLGLTYRVRSSAEDHPVYIHNLKILQDFLAHDVAVSPEQAALVLLHVAAHPGIRLLGFLLTNRIPKETCQERTVCRMMRTNRYWIRSHGGRERIRFHIVKRLPRIISVGKSDNFL